MRFATPRVGFMESNACRHLEAQEMQSTFPMANALGSWEIAELKNPRAMRRRNKSIQGDF